MRAHWITALSFLAAGCSGANTTSYDVGNPAGALITAIAAGAVWAIGGGCKLQGCPYGSFCDKATGYCQVMRCSDGCPPLTMCNEGLDRCQDPPPAQAPNDFLPGDNKLQNPPGTRY